MVAEHHIGRRGHIVLAVLELVRRRRAVGVDAPLLGEPTAVKDVATYENHDGYQKDDQGIHDLLPLFSPWASKRGRAPSPGSALPSFRKRRGGRVKPMPIADSAARGVTRSIAGAAATSSANSSAVVDERIGLERFSQRFSLRIGRHAPARQVGHRQAQIGPSPPAEREALAEAGAGARAPTRDRPRRRRRWRATDRSSYDRVRAARGRAPRR